MAEASNRRRSCALGEPSEGASGVGSAEVASVSRSGPDGGAAGWSPDAAGAPGGSPAPSSSTYGRMRSGSKSSAAAAWAVRASRRASDALVPQAQDGVLSAALGVPHSGQAAPADPPCDGSFCCSTRWSLPSRLPSRTPEIMQIFSTLRRMRPRNAGFPEDGNGHTRSHPSQDSRRSSLRNQCSAYGLSLYASVSV